MKKAIKLRWILNDLKCWSFQIDYIVVKFYASCMIIAAFRVRKSQQSIQSWLVWYLCLAAFIQDPFSACAWRKFPYIIFLLEYFCLHLPHYFDFYFTSLICFYRWKRENRCKFFFCTSYRLMKIGSLKIMASYQLSGHHQMI